MKLFSRLIFVLFFITNQDHRQPLRTKASWHMRACDGWQNPMSSWPIRKPVRCKAVLKFPFWTPWKAEFQLDHWVTFMKLHILWVFFPLFRIIIHLKDEGYIIIPMKGTFLHHFFLRMIIQTLFAVSLIQAALKYFHAFFSKYTKYLTC